MLNAPENQSPPPNTYAPQYGDPYQSAPPPPAPGRNGFAVAGLIVAFFAAPIGFILSIVGLVQAGKRGQKGKGMAVAGIIVSVILMGVGSVLVVQAGKTAATLTDPGCTTAKSALFDNKDALGDPDPAKAKQAFQATVDGLNSAAAKAKQDKVRNAIKPLAADYTELLNDVTTGTAPAAGMQDKIDAHAAALDKLCTLGA
jgi:hypothetical protein